MARLQRGVLTRTDVRHGRALNVASKRREIPLVQSKLDGLLLNKNPTICVYRRLGGIGDVLMTTPMLKHIKRIIPGCHLIYATDLAYADGALGDIIRYNPFVDELISYQDIKIDSYDLFTDVTATGLSQERAQKVPPNRIDMFAQQIGVDISSDPLPTYVVTKEEAEWAKTLINKHCAPAKREDVTLIGLQIKSNDTRRTWPIDHNLELIQKLTKNPKVRVAIFYLNSDRRLFDIPHTFICDHKWREQSAIVNECDIVVAPDSAILHAAGALQKKIVAIFGPTAPESRINHYANATAVTASMPCLYCWYSPTCSSKMDCLKKITPDAVLDAIQNRLAGKAQTKEVLVASKTKDISASNSLLVTRHCGGFGDIIQTIPAIEALRTRFPTKKIFYAIPKKYWPAAENNPVIERLLDADQRIQNVHYSVVADITSPCAVYESNQIKQRKKVEKTRTEVYADALGVKGIIKKTTGAYYVSEEEKNWASKFLPPTDKPRLAIVLHCAEQYREWPASQYNRLIPLLTEHFQACILDTTRDQEYPGTIDCAGFPFRKSAAIVDACDIVLTPDTAHLHVGMALGKHVVALFGPIDPHARTKGYKKIKIITAKKDCIPCWRNQQMACRSSGSSRGYSDCMQAIPVKDVYETLLSVKESL